MERAREATRVTTDRAARKGRSPQSAEASEHSEQATTVARMKFFMSSFNFGLGIKQF